eukprot:g5378.t1
MYTYRNLFEEEEKEQEREVLRKGIGGHLRVRCSDFVVYELEKQKEKNIAHHAHAATAREAFRIAFSSPSSSSSERRPFLKLEMTKAKLSTLKAISTLSDFCEIRRASITFAGIKDAKAVTSQEITIYEPTALQRKRLDELNMDNLKLSKYRYVRKPLFPGWSRGNRFQIVLRGFRKNISVDRHALRIANCVKRDGFLNYFGTQRFSGTATRNERVASCYLKRDCVGAVDAVLSPQPWGCATESERSARLAWKDMRDPRSASKLMPRHLGFERQILKGLIDATKYAASSSLTTMTHPERCRIAFLSTPFPDRLLCINAFFSRLWNKTASARIEQSSSNVLVGDLVYDVDCEGGVRVLTERDVRSKRYAMTDVLLPLPGALSTYPSHFSGTYMRTFLQYENITGDAFTVEKGLGEDDLHMVKGAYRPVVVRPARFSASIVRYDKVAEPVFVTFEAGKKVLSMRTDARGEMIDDKILRALAASVEDREIVRRTLCGFEESTWAVSERESKSRNRHACAGRTGAFVAIAFSFDLPPGTYATSLLREIMRGEGGAKAGGATGRGGQSHRRKRHIKFDD